MIAFEGVTVQYRTASRAAVRRVSCRAGDGELTAIVGPNGSGKSSLVRTLLRQVPVREGVVRCGDRPIDQWQPRELARSLAVVSQREEPAFPLLVAEYVAMGRVPHRDAWTGERAVDREVIDAALAATGMGALRERRTTELSGGEWQRVRLARALAQDTPHVVLDEPTSFLDIAHEMEAFELLESMARRGRCVLVVSHQLNLVARFAHRVVLLSAGEVAADGPPVEIMRGEILERVYGWPLVVTRDPAVGAPTLVPLRR